MLGRGVVGFAVLALAPLMAFAGDGGVARYLSREAIYQVVHAHEPAIKSCYEAQMKKDASLAGEIDVAWDIETDGGVARARVTRTTMNSAPVEGCIVTEVSNWRFPTGPERTTVGKFPFVFKNGTPPRRPPAAPSP